MPNQLANKLAELEAELETLIEQGSLDPEHLAKCRAITEDIQLIKDLSSRANKSNYSWSRTLVYFWAVLLLLLVGLYFRGPNTEVSIDAQTRLLEIELGNDKDLMLGRSTLRFEGLNIQRIERIREAADADNFARVRRFEELISTINKSYFITISELLLTPNAKITLRRAGSLLTVEIDGLVEIWLSVAGNDPKCTKLSESCSDNKFPPGVVVTPVDRKLDVVFTCQKPDVNCFDEENTWAAFSSAYLRLGFQNQVGSAGNASQVMRGLEDATAVFGGYGSREVMIHRWEELTIEGSSLNFRLGPHDGLMQVDIYGLASVGDDNNQRSHHPSLIIWITENPLIALILTAATGLLGLIARFEASARSVVRKFKW